MEAISRSAAGARTVATGTFSRAWVLLLAAGFLSQSGVLHGQKTQPAGATESPMKLHYEAAFKFQGAGDIVRANSEYRLYLSMALHRIANGHANLGEYAHAVELYEESLRLAPDDEELKIDYAAAALGGADGDVSLVIMLDLETEVEMKLPGRFKVSPQIAGAIKAVSGVVDVQTL